MSRPLTEDNVRQEIEQNKNYRGYEELMLSIALLQLDELKAIRKATEDLAGALNRAGDMLCVEVDKV